MQQATRQKVKIVAPALVVLCALIGFTCKQNPYEIRELGREGDQQALKHRDSPYSHISWICSDAGNYAQLRFFDKVEGSACLHPTWDHYKELAETEPSLAHLVPDKPWAARGKPDKTWPEDKPHPSPGTLSNTKYVCLFPTAVLLNRDLMQEADYAPRKAKPNIIIVGLGSAIGISVYAHHFPEASITVVDIDQVVIDMVLDHYPFIEWLSKQQCSDGRPRLKLVASDARQYIHYPHMRDNNDMKYDIAVLDAYTSGSTIPSHLMTKEFFQEIKKLLRPNGILLSNIIGSYTGAKHFVVGGAMRSMQAAGFEHVHNFPIIEHPQRTTEHLVIDETQARNNIIVACGAPLDPTQYKHGWERLKLFLPYPDLKDDTYVSEQIMLLQSHNNSNEVVSTSISVPPSLDPDHLRQLRGESQKQKRDALSKVKTLARSDDFTRAFIEDSGLITACVEAVQRDHSEHLPKGWSRAPNNPVIYYSRMDWVLYARRTYQRSIMAAQSRGAYGYMHDAINIVGRPNGDLRASSLIPDAPVFTDAQPNADIYNR